MSDRKLAMPTPPENVPNVSAPPPPPAILPEVTMVEIKLAVEGEFVRRMKQLEADNARLTAELAELRERARWIPTGERLPEKNSHVLVCMLVNDADVFGEVGRIEDESEYNGERFVCFLGEYVTHWMPLPEPPEAD